MVQWNVAYFPTQIDAIGYTNVYGGSVADWIVGAGGPYGGYTRWIVAAVSDPGGSPPGSVWNNGDELITGYNYQLYPAQASGCFLEGSTILCLVDEKEEYVPIESIRTGTLVKTSRDGYKRVEIIGKGPIKNPGTDERSENRLYCCPVANYPELTTDLYITGCHSILVDSLTPAQKVDTISHLGATFMTGNKFRLIACVDERAEPWASEGTYTIWHVALENSQNTFNYGVYANGGLLVETCSLNFLKNKSNMTCI